MTRGKKYFLVYILMTIFFLKKIIYYITYFVYVFLNENKSMDSILQYFFKYRSNWNITIV